MGDGPPLEAAPRAPLGPPPHNYFTQVANPGGVALLGPPPTTQPWLAGSYARARGSGSPPSSRRSYRRARCAARRRFASSTQAVTLVLLLIPAWLRAALGVGEGWERGGGRADGRKGWGWEERATNTHTAIVAFARLRAGAVAEQSPSRSPA